MSEEKQADWTEEVEWTKAPPLKLDDTTEGLIRALPQLAQDLLGCKNVTVLPLAEITRRTDAYEAAENALRRRIRELVEGPDHG